MKRGSFLAGGGGFENGHIWGEDEKLRNASKASLRLRVILVVGKKTKGRKGLQVTWNEERSLILFTAYFMTTHPIKGIIIFSKKV